MEELRSSNLRDYVIFYRPLGDAGVAVVRILHSARDVNAEFFR